MFKQEIQNKILDLFQKVGTTRSVDDIVAYFKNHLKETSVKTEILELILQGKLVLTNENKIKIKKFEGNNAKCDCTKPIYEKGTWEKIIKNNAYLDSTSKNKVCKKCGHTRGQHCNSGNDLAIECMDESCPCKHFVEQIKNEKSESSKDDDEILKTQNGYDGYFYSLKAYPAAKIEVKAEVGGHGCLYSIIMPPMYSSFGDEKVLNGERINNVLKVLNRVLKDYHYGIRIVKGDIKDI